MRGGISSLYVYAPWLIEPVIVGNTFSPVLRIVNVRGKNGDLVEDNFQTIQYHKLLVKEVSEIEIEIRSSTGHLIPFDYGTCTLTLHFKKIAYF